MFFKKLHVLFNDLPSHFKKISKDNKRYIYNFDGALADNGGYFNAIRGFIRIEYKKMSNNVYSVKMTIKNNKLFICAYIDINLL